jgi:hypothetical protein
MGQVYRDAMRFVDRLDTQEWLIVGIVAIVVGVLCLRGFGSRSGY